MTLFILPNNLIRYLSSLSLPEPRWLGIPSQIE
jgi:hypothetical protein